MVKIYSWNVNGIRAVVRKGLFTPFIEKEQPDIVCLQETKAKQGQAEIELAGYEEYWNSADKAIKVMDKAAIGLAMEQHMPVVVFDALTDDNILYAGQDKPVGTYIS